MAANAALDSLMLIINNLRIHPRPPISLDKNQVYLLTQKITFLQEFLEAYNPQLPYSTEADPLETRIADAAYAAEDVIESHIVDQIFARSTNDGKKMRYDGLHEAIANGIEEMASIEKVAMQIKETVGVQHQLHRNSSPPDSSRSSLIAQQSGMVGADELLRQMKDKLVSYCGDLQIIPVVGMGGAGKTTLARNIYQDSLIKEHFHICAWITISQEYSIQEILIQVLKQLNEHVDQHLSENDLGVKLHKHLYGRRYLIILDDMWSIKAWEGIRSFLPKNENGSRVVITTRLSNLASEISNSNVLEMTLLDEVDSWDLLSKIVFGEESCPLELEEIGRKIGISCKGLPLSIVVVGGLLAKSNHTREFWEYIEEHLNENVNLEDNGRCLRILHMSYRQLPVYLKPCFLYMGVYPEDEEIRISKLIKLWVAEGFIKSKSGKYLEETAKEYLKDLIGRNLIMIHQLGGTGNIKMCKIHDLLRDLSLREAEKERFYTIVGRTPSPRRIVNAAQRRIIIHDTTSKNEGIEVLSSVSLTRSLTWDLDPSDELPQLDLRLLRILDSRRYKDQYITPIYPKNLHQLVNSRFLDISEQLSDSEFPSSIWLFWNLQTLIVSCTNFTAPTTFWCMPHIRHVDFSDIYLRLPDPPNGQDNIVLGNLQTLGVIVDFKCSKQVVNKIPNVKKLKIRYDEGVDDDRYCLSNLDCLDKLESLSCKFSEKMMNPSGRNSYVQGLINFPHSLKKLTLEINPSQCWEDMLDKIVELPLLQKLKLNLGSFKEGHWETKGLFRSLKYFSLHNCGLQIWTAESSHFPCLEQLHLDHADALEEIPLDFAEIPTLGVIELVGCRNSAIFSAQRILEEREGLYGEPAIQVEVRLMWKDEALESLASPNFRLNYF